ncbi:MAG: histidine kinase dimerization/phospho-acceptor domain-containing protein [Gammaproteobacteria bacterium]|nr:histidine kinase dimerization/phospho-acceptor domain-containing protein [Gammaproteobacteria bacterium]
MLLGAGLVAGLAGSGVQFRRGLLPGMALVFGTLMTLMLELGFLVPAGVSHGAADLLPAVLAIVGTAALGMPALALRVGPSRLPITLLAGLLLGASALLPQWLYSWWLMGSGPAAATSVADSESISVGIAAVLVLVTMHGLVWLLVWGGSDRVTRDRRSLLRLNAALSALLEDSPDWVGLLDRQGRVIDDLPRRQVPGLGDPRGEYALDDAPRAVREESLRLFREALDRPRTPVRGELVFTSEAGSEEVVAVIVDNRLDDPDIEAVILTVRSLTALRELEAGAFIDREMSRKLFEHAPLPMLIADADSGYFLDVNPALVRLYGYEDRASMIGLTAADLVPHRDTSPFDDYRRRLDALGEAGGHVEMNAVHRTLGGRDSRSGCVGTQFAVGSRRRRITMVEDISATERERHLLRGEIGLLGTLVEQRDPERYAREVLAWLCRDPLGLSGALLACRMPRGSALRLASGRLDEIQLQPDPMEASVLEQLASAHRAVVEGEALGIRCEEPGLLLAAVRDRHGEVRGVLAVIGDGERAGLAAALELGARLLGLSLERHENDLLLQHGQRIDTLGRITGGIAHDFNNLLTVMLGNLEMLEGSPSLSGEDREALSTAIQGAQRAASITGRLLSLARRQPSYEDEVDLAEVVSGAPELLGSILGERIRFRVECPGTPIRVRCDRSLLESALINLALNAQGRPQRPRRGGPAAGRGPSRCADPGRQRQHRCRGLLADRAGGRWPRHERTGTAAGPGSVLHHQGRDRRHRARSAPGGRVRDRSRRRRGDRQWAGAGHPGGDPDSPPRGGCAARSPVAPAEDAARRRCPDPVRGGRTAGGRCRLPDPGACRLRRDGGIHRRRGARPARGGRSVRPGLQRRRSARRHGWHRPGRVDRSAPSGSAGGAGQWLRGRATGSVLVADHAQALCPSGPAGSRLGRAGKQGGSCSWFVDLTRNCCRSAPSSPSTP